MRSEPLTAEEERDAVIGAMPWYDEAVGVGAMTTDHDAMSRIAKRHRKQEFYRGQQVPTRANHKTGALAICAHCRQPWPCDASILARALARTGGSTDGE